MGEKTVFGANSACDQEAKLTEALAALQEIGTKINRLGVNHNLGMLLQLIVEHARQAIVVSIDPATPEPKATAAIWIYDQARQRFEPSSGTAAGEPVQLMADQWPRPDGLARRAIRYRRRLLSYEERGLSLHPTKQAAGARALACYPLISADEVVGVFYIYRYDEQRFSQLELLLLDNFANLAAMAIQHGRQVGGVARSLARKVSQLEKLGVASRLINSQTNLDEALQEILSIGLDMTAAQYGTFELYDKKRGVLLVKALVGRYEEVTSDLSLPVDEQSIVGWVASRRQSLLISDLRDSTWQAIYHPLPADQEMRSELAVPLIGAGGGLEGVLNIESPQPNAFTIEDQQILEALATQTVIALQEIRLLDALQEIIEVLLTTELDELLKLIIDRACDLINVPFGSIWTLLDSETLVLRQSTHGYRQGNQLPLNRSFTGQAIRLRQPLTVDDVRIHPDFQHRQLAVEQGWISAIVVPLLLSDESNRALGSFTLYADHLRDFSDWDKKLLTCLANHAALAIQNAERLAQLKQAQERQAIAETFAAVGDVAANLLHQLNNKIGAIPARVQGIEDKCSVALKTSPYLADNLLEIERSARQAMAIVRNSMAHLRPIKPQPVDISQCLERALQRAQPAATVQVLRTDLEYLPRVVAGEQQLEMVIYNLIDNALTAMAGQGELHVRGAWHGSEVALTVADTGPGIPLELQARLFEFSPDPDEAKVNWQLGFGLWWVKTFVDRFGGRLLLESEPGKGSAFTVWLPAERGMR